MTSLDLLAHWPQVLAVGVFVLTLIAILLFPRIAWAMKTLKLLVDKIENLRDCEVDFTPCSKMSVKEIKEYNNLGDLITITHYLFYHVKKNIDATVTDHLTYIVVVIVAFLIVLMVMSNLGVEWNSSVDAISIFFGISDAFILISCAYRLKYIWYAASDFQKTLEEYPS